MKVFQSYIKVNYHSSKSSICASFARHSLASSDSDCFYSLFGAPEDYYHFVVEKLKSLSVAVSLD
jgi:hypothetical protein